MKKRLAFVCLFLCLAWTVFIFARSAKSVSESLEESGTVLEILSRILSFLGIQNMPSEHFVRKLGHFTEYAVLALPAFFAAKLLPTRFSHVCAFGYCAAVACFDEFLVQNLSVGRGPSIFDVAIDSAGAAVVVLVLAVWCGLRKRVGRRPTPRKFLKKLD
jgi:VanZ family protein